MTDNAANMKHGFELMTAADDTEAMWMEQKTSQRTYGTEDKSENFWKPIELKIKRWIGCCAHQLQLVVNDGYNKLRSYQRIQNILSKAKAISAFSRSYQRIQNILSKAKAILAFSQIY